MQEELPQLTLGLIVNWTETQRQPKGAFTLDTFLHSAALFLIVDLCKHAKQTSLMVAITAWAKVIIVNLS